MEVKVGGVFYPWRRTYEVYGVLAWVVMMLLSLLMMMKGDMPSSPFLAVLVTSVVMMGYKLYLTHDVLRRKVALTGKQLKFVDSSEVIKKMNRKRSAFWVGEGFEWKNEHSQYVYDLKKLNVEELFPPSKITEAIAKIYDYRGIPSADEEVIGKTWIHGVEPKSIDLYTPDAIFAGHSLIAATTGWGKTRMFELISTQIIWREERRCLIVVDPKGDHELKEALRLECEKAGRPEDFLYFHPAHPGKSVRINPLKNYNRSTELASRIASLIRTESGGDSFQDFAWRAINIISSGLIMVEENPTLVDLKRYVQGGPDQLLEKTLMLFFDKNIEDWREKVKSYIERASSNRRNRPDENISDELVGMVNFYKKEIQGKHTFSSTQTVEGLINMYTHDRAHAQKMLAVLVPILEMLTAGPLEQLLSPNPKDRSDMRAIADTKNIVSGGKILYLGLDSLSDNRVGAAIGSIFLADIAAVAGDRYNYETNSIKAHILVDEAAECISPPFVALLNKGRGAGFVVTVATQTIPDFIASTGNEAMARQILGNINNRYCGRINDKVTMEYMTEMFGEATILTRMHTQSTSAMQGDKDPTNYTGGYGERLIPVEEETIPPDFLGSLPNFEYIGSYGGKIVKGIIPIILH